MTNEFDAVKRPAPLPESWTLVQLDSSNEGWERTFEAYDSGTPVGRVSVRHTLTSRLHDAYPAGARDLELSADTRRSEVLQLVSDHLFAEDPDCRRIVLGVPEDTVEFIASAEQAGFRYVIDVDLPEGESLSLLVAEPEWVLSQPTAVDALPET